MIRSIVKKGNPLLTQKCELVTDIESVQSIIGDLKDTLTSLAHSYAFTRGSGIAAPQIGESIRVSVVEYENIRYTLINPEIVSHSETQEPIREGCLSFFDYRGLPLRYSEVVVSYMDENGNLQSIEARNDFASLLQHEIDHLDGILYPQRMLPGEALSLHDSMPDIP